MHNKVTWCAATVALIAGQAASAQTPSGEITDYNDKVVNKIGKYLVQLPASDNVPYDGVFAANFPNGFVPGIGSSLTFDGVEAEDRLRFTFQTDRGPNASSPKSLDNTPTKIFATPDFTPEQFTISLSHDGELQLEQRSRLKIEENGQATRINGLPLPKGTVGSTGEVALGDDLKALQYHTTYGLDTEGVTPDGQGGYWIGDEYGPFIVHTDGQGLIKARYGPKAEGGEATVAEPVLPAILAKRTPNRGFEAIARNADTGKVYAAVQSILTISPNTPFLRIVEFDPKTKETRQFAYPMDVDILKSMKAGMIGDMEWVEGDRFILLEHGDTKEGVKDNRGYYNTVYLIDISQATDINGMTVEADITDDGQNNPEAVPLEWIGSTDAEGNAIEKPSDLTYVAKGEILDLRDYGWSPKKSEGLTVVDANRFAVSNDSDFGMTGELVHPDADEDSLKDYHVDPSTGELLLATNNDAPTLTHENLFAVEGVNAQNHLWVVELAMPINSFLR